MVIWILMFLLASAGLAWWWCRTYEITPEDKAELRAYEAAQWEKRRDY